MPPVVLTGFQLFGNDVAVGDNSPLKQSISITNFLTLTHAQNVFSFEFSALSYASPERNRYRYRLEPLENNWNETDSNRRFVSYTTLAPGEYVFRVQGSNNRGVWNESGVSVRIRILPPWWGTWWFRTILAALIVAVLAALYQLRLQQVTHQINIGVEARVNERTRIARDLHDTLLQSFQGLVLRFQAVDEMLSTRPMEAKKAMGSALDRADQAIIEGRDAITEMRTSSLAGHDLPKSMSALMTHLSEEISAGNGGPVSFRVRVEGTPLTVRRLIQDEIYRIAGSRCAIRSVMRTPVISRRKSPTPNLCFVYAFVTMEKALIHGSRNAADVPATGVCLESTSEPSASARDWRSGAKSPLAPRWS